MRFRALVHWHLLLASAFVAGGHAAAEPLYLYSAKEDQTSEEMVAGLKSARDAHLAALDRHDSNIAAAITKERELVTRRELAQRDADIARYLETSQSSASTARMDLSDIMRYRLKSVFGTDAGEKGFANKLRRVQADRDELDETIEARDRMIALERVQGAAGGKCTDTGTREGDLSRVMQSYCTDVADRHEKLQNRLSCDDPAITALAAVARLEECRAGAELKRVPWAGELGEASKGAAAAAIAKQSQQALVKAAKERLQALSCYLEREAGGQGGESIISAAKKLDELLAGIEGLWNQAEPANATGQADALVKAVAASTPVGEGSSCPKPKENVAALEALGRKLLPALLALGEFKPTRAVIADLRAEVESFRAGKLGELLQITADPAKAGAATDAPLVALIAKSEAPVETLINAARGTLPDTSGVLVELAEARMRASVAEIEASRLGDLERILSLRARALTQEAVNLLRAIEAAPTGPESRTLLAYSDSFAKGRVPAAVLERDAQNLELKSWSRRERASVEAAYGALDAVTAELRAYGKGGIRPEDIARFLNVAGLAAIARTN